MRSENARLPFETLNALAKRLENRKGRGRAHVLVQLIGEMICSLFVLSVLTNELESESRRTRAEEGGAAAAHGVVRQTGDMVH